MAIFLYLCRFQNGSILGFLSKFIENFELSKIIANLRLLDKKDAIFKVYERLQCGDNQKLVFLLVYDLEI